MVWGELFCFVCFPFCSYGLGVSLGKGYIFLLREIKITPDAFVHTCTVYHLYLINLNCHSSIKIKKKYFTVTYNKCGKNIKNICKISKSTKTIYQFHVFWNHFTKLFKRTGCPQYKRRIDRNGFVRERNEWHPLMT